MAKRASLKDIRKGKRAAVMEQSAEPTTGPKKLTAYVTESDWRRLNNLGMGRRGKVSGIIRDALDAWLTKHGQSALEKLDRRERE